MTHPIHSEHLYLFMSAPFAGTYFAPFLALSAKYQDKGPWVWEHERAVEEARMSLWDMLAKWQALRAKLVDHAAFDLGVVAPAGRIARVLNSQDITCMHQIAKMPAPAQAKLLHKIQTEVMELSKLKPTKNVEPMFGSKIAHHLFPSVVPVFDTAMIRKKVMMLDEYRTFVEEDGHGLITLDEKQAGGAAGLEFHCYFAFCIHNIATAKPKALADARRVFYKESVRSMTPVMFDEDGDHWVHRLDAKVAEFCLLGVSKL